MGSDEESEFPYDIFLSHASEDKDEFVRPLAKSLEVAGIRVWYDESEIDAGSSIRGEIDKGLLEARHVIVVLSEHYFEKAWAKQEFDAATDPETYGPDLARKSIPIFHKITIEEVKDKSPMIARLRGISSSEDLDQVVQEIVKGFELEDRVKQSSSEREALVVNFELTEDCDAESGYCVSLEMGDRRSEGQLSHAAFQSARSYVAKCEANAVSFDDLKYLGSLLHDSLIGDDVRDDFEEFREILSENDDVPIAVRLCVPQSLDPIPWEAIYDEQYGSFIATHPDYSVFRAPPQKVRTKPAEDRELGRLKILMVGPEGSGLPAAEQEMSSIEKLAKPFGDGVQVERLTENVTPDALRNRLEKEAWDIVHFIGHGVVGDDNRMLVRLNPEDGNGDAESFDIPAEKFGDMFRSGSVSLVFLNSCYGVHVDGSDSLNGVAPALMRAGVSAVVGMRYEIEDREALRLSEEFYRNLLNGKKPGSVDHAIQKARESLYYNSSKNPRGFVSPTLYLAVPPGRLFLIPEIEASELQGSAPSPALPIAASVEIPDGLIRAMEEKNCIPFVGTGLFGLKSVHRSGDVPRPVAEQMLAEKLAKQCDYPRSEDLKLTEYGHSEWLESIVLEWVCQHFQFENNRAALLRAIRDELSGALVPEPIREVTGWNLPGIIYTYFDGAIERAAQELGKTVQPVRDVSVPSENNGSTPLLVLLRGSIDELKSLVLTEDDHDDLWYKLANSRVSKTVTNLVKGELDRSLLLLGVDPRDRFVRRLCSQLVDTTENTTQGPVYFVHPDPTAVDRAYWKKFQTEWIEARPEEFVHVLKEATGGR